MYLAALSSLLRWCLISSMDCPSGSVGGAVLPSSKRETFMLRRKVCPAGGWVRVLVAISAVEARTEWYLNDVYRVKKVYVSRISMMGSLAAVSDISTA